MSSTRVSCAMAIPGGLGVAGPLPFAGHDDVEVERAQQAQALGPGVVVHSGERLVEGDQTWGVRTARARVMGGSRGEEGHGGRQRAFTARGGPSGWHPFSVLMAFDSELVPVAVVQGRGEILQPASGPVLSLSARDLLLEERADSGSVLGRPGVG